MKKLGLIAAGAFAVVLFSGAPCLQAEETKPLKPQENCPMMVGKVNKTLYVDALGQRIYVCCKGCIGLVKENPAAALKKLAEKGEFAESLQKTCPIMGGKINSKLFVEHEGRRIYVCCAGCIATVKKDPKKYAEKVDKKIAEDMAEEVKKVKDVKAKGHHNGHH